MLNRFLLWGILAVSAAWCAGPKWVNLLNGKNLDGWETVNDGFWNVLSDGTLVGQRDMRTAEHQAWIYTKKEFGEFELEVEFWTRARGNSGISILDTSRGHFSFGPQFERMKTPSHVGYEIQISFGYPDEYTTGSIYNFVKAKPGAERENDWNTMNIEHRDGMVRVKLNGILVAEWARDSDRATRGPIGFQLHDKYSVVMFRHPRIREFNK
ncbi:MAG: DUF1080 domain-containing protein [Acidobacteriales bacterium]|nr:DUF1080 domain-containing protein [Terriglobales bacterium]